MRVATILYVIFFLNACSMTDFASYDKYAIKFNDTMFESISSIGQSREAMDINSGDFLESKIIKTKSKRVKLYINNGLLKQCRVNGIDSEDIAKFLRDLVIGEDAGDNKKYNASIYLTLEKKFNYKIFSDIDVKELAFVFSLESCANYHAVVFFAYSIVQHERKHVEIFMSEKLKDIPAYINEYLATKLSYCSILKNEQILSVDIFPSKKIRYQSIKDVPKGESIPPVLGANIFHNEAFKLFKSLKWTKKSENYAEIIKWCESESF
ncbi:hypothetical protein AYI72_06390 [Shewanella algae]|uniref:hypothetical protein n=1 Tax=Shewanella algae TaxID=38313 RepID=UPI00118318C0|nr:hypothetical protein [Shewanella algae]MBO2623833.1 hypothetical protein [Shewanella algae]TVL07603.1 hypothetical protein AYI72_06390 [Shewanella algae]